MEKLFGGRDWTSASTASTGKNTCYLKNVVWALLKYFLLEYIVLITGTKYSCTQVQ
jgi:hypothetical protein